MGLWYKIETRGLHQMWIKTKMVIHGRAGFVPLGRWLLREPGNLTGCLPSQSPESSSVLQPLGCSFFFHPQMATGESWGEEREGIRQGKCLLPSLSVLFSLSCMLPLCSHKAPGWGGGEISYPECM